MVDIRITRHSSEALGDAPDQPSVTGLDVQVAADADEAVGGEVRVTRLHGEVLGTAKVVAATALDVQVAADADEDVEGEVLITRLSAEVLGANLTVAAVTALDVQVAADADEDAGGPVRITRLSAELLSVDTGLGPVVPLDLADGLSIFLHNWATRAQIVTEWRTDIMEAPESSEESRYNQVIKPFRTLTFEWLEGSNNRRNDLEAVDRMLRSMSGQPFQMPLYMDQYEMLSVTDSLDTVLSTPGRLGRYYRGARVAIVKPTFDMHTDTVVIRQIINRTDSTLTLDSAVGVDFPIGTLLFPLIDCEMLLDVQSDYIRQRRVRVLATVTEVAGNSALPGSNYGNPGVYRYLNIPIFNFEPNWVDVVQRGRSRTGSVDGQGRGTVVYGKGPRSRQVHTYSFLDYREEAWRLLNFFDWARGAYYAFWHIDFEGAYIPSDIQSDGSSVSVFELTSQANFEEELDYIGLEMRDGTHIVREVQTVNTMSGQYVVTPTVLFPTGLVVGDIVRIAKARKSRFQSDSFTEQWATTNVLPTEVSIIELLNE